MEINTVALSYQFEWGCLSLRTAHFNGTFLFLEEYLRGCPLAERELFGVFSS